MEIASVKQDWRLDPGEDWEIAFDILNTAGAVIDLSAATIECKIREFEDINSALIFDFAAGGPIEVTVDDEIVLTFPLASTTLVTQSEGFYDCAVTCTAFNGERHYVLEGKFKFGKRVT